MYWRPVLLLAFLKMIFHLLFIERYGIHRDELLYLALGEHPAAGFWSTPPLTGWISWLVQHTLGDALWAIRLPSLLAGCLLVILAGMMAREMGGGRYAQLLAAGAVMVSPAYLRTSHMFMPVVFDIVFWTLMCWSILRFLNTERDRYLLLFGICWGFGFLNKYSVAFLLTALIPVLLFSRHRRVLWSVAAVRAAGLALLIISPNLLWQYANGFPVITHMSELARYQLGNVLPLNFLFDQLLMNLPAAFVWPAGLGWLLLSDKARLYRPIGGLYLTVIVLFILLSGKSYYTLGIYPVLMAAGGVAWERWISSWHARLALPLAMLLLLLPILPLGVPVLPVKRLLPYCNWLVKDIGIDGPMRWEDGRIHPIPQDYADMHGWAAIAGLTHRAYRQVPEGKSVMIYGENYGQAGAIDYYGDHLGLPGAVSFSDSYRLWLPERPGVDGLIYINDELGQDVVELFAEVRLIGQVEHPLARERGTAVYLCLQPRRNLDDFWAERVAMVRER